MPGLTRRSMRRVVSAGRSSDHAARPPSQFARPLCRCTRSGFVSCSARRIRSAAPSERSLRIGTARVSKPRRDDSAKAELPGGHTSSERKPRARSPSSRRKSWTSPPEKPDSPVTCATESGVVIEPGKVGQLALASRARSSGGTA